MMRRAAFVLGAAVGYVLGTRAGREKYEQMREAARRLTENPTVQETAGTLRSQAGEMAGTAKDKVGAKLQGSRIGERIPGRQAGEGGEISDQIPDPQSATPMP